MFVAMDSQTQVSVGESAKVVPGDFDYLDPLESRQEKIGEAARREACILVANYGLTF
jgi:hypothetical protein